MRTLSLFFISSLLLLAACVPPQPPWDKTPVSSSEVVVYNKQFKTDTSISQIIQLDLESGAENVVDQTSNTFFMVWKIQKVGEGPYVIYDWGQLLLPYDILTINKSFNASWTVPWATNLKNIGTADNPRASRPYIAPTGNAVVYGNYYGKYYDVGLDWWYTDVTIVDMVTRESILVDTYQAPGVGFFNRWSPDGRKFAYRHRNPYALKIYSLDSQAIIATGSYYNQYSTKQRSAWLDNRYYVNVLNGEYAVLDTQTNLEVIQALPGIEEVNPSGTENGRFMILHSDGTDNFQSIGYANGQAPLLIDVLGSPQWSPNGAMLAFARDQDNDGVAELYVGDADGNSPRLISGTHQLTGSYTSYEIVWAPDNSGFLLQAVDGFYYVGASDSVSTQLTNAIVADASWSPDSSVFAYRSGGSFFISSVDTSPTLIASNIDVPPSFSSTQPTLEWSKISTRLLFVAVGETVDVGGMQFDHPAGLVDYSLYPYQIDVIAEQAREAILVTTQ